MRLNKYLALCGVASRRKCDQYIEEEKVLVNNQIGTLGTIVDPKKDTVLFEGQQVLQDTKKYYLFYKPIGVLTTLTDPFERKCLGEYLETFSVRLFSVGRLDADSEGLLVLTNDGDFSHQLQHPKYKVDKVYRLWVNQVLSAKQMQKFQEGILLEEGVTAPAIIKHINNLEYEVIIRQGWHRQIRRMIQFLGAHVSRLQRVAVGKYQLGNLKPGEFKEVDRKI